MSCIFCGIAKGEMQCYKVGENEGAVAFLDIHPHSLGHTVIIPKEHAAFSLQADLDSWKSVIFLVRDCMSLLEKKLGVEAFNVGWNEGSLAGQVVEHWHVHILPRYSGDRGGSVHSIVKNHPDEPVEKVFRQLTSRS